MSVILRIKTNNPNNIVRALYNNGNFVNSEIIGLLPPPTNGKYYSDKEGCYVLPFRSDQDATAFKLKNTGFTYL